MSEQNQVATVANQNPFANAMTAASPRNLAQSSAAAAETQRAIAEVQAAIMLAKQFPRDRVAAYERIMNECCREGLAHVAVYTYTRGGTEISGPSIRLAEALAREWGNIQAGWKEVSRQNGVSEVEAWAWDVETNTRFPVSFHVKHWRDTRQGGYHLKDERDIYELLANNASRRLRACILRALPGDVVEAATKQCEATLATNVVITPERIKNMVDEFAKFGVTKEAMEKRVQRRIDTINGPQMLTLVKIYNSLKDGMSTAAEWFDIEETEQPKKGSEGVKETLKAASQAQASQPAEVAKPVESVAKPSQLESKPGELAGEDANLAEELASEKGAEESAVQTQARDVAGAHATDFDLETQAGTTQALNALLKKLDATPQDERGAAFAEFGGNDLLDAMGRHGLGTKKRLISQRGVTLPA